MSAKKKSTSTAKKYSAVPPVAVAPRPADTKVEIKAIEPKAIETKAVETKVEAKPVEAPKAAAAATTTVATPVAMAADHRAKLIETLNGHSAEEACDAAIDLAAAGSEAVDALSAVVANASSYYNPIVRSAAAASLGKIADARAVPALLVGVRDSMAEASAESVRALTAIGDRRALSALIDVVRNADGFFLPAVRLAAVVGLKKLGGPEAAAALAVVAANTNEEASIRQAVSA